MKIYFWNGTEFNKTSPPCCEVHTKNYIIKLFVIGKIKNTFFSIYKKYQTKIPAWKFYDTPNPNIRLLWMKKETPELVERKPLG